jgi:hypothetical protein
MARAPAQDSKGFVLLIAMKSLLAKTVFPEMITTGAKT